ncbi:MAG: T9SS type A sorting domain-containing protein [Bacteroidota bacterium]
MYQNRLSTILCFCLFFTASISYAQITITNSDLTQYYQIGSVVTFNLDTMDTNVMLDIGSPGGGNTWDFSNVQQNLISEQQMILDPAGTPGAANYGDANIAIFFDFQDEEGSGSIYNYLDFDATGINFLGSYSTVQVDGSTSVTTTTYNPVERTLSLPLAFNDTWSYQGKLAITTTFGGASFPINESDESNTYQVDAYGTLTFPDGSSEAALRVRQLTTSTSELIPNFPITSTSLSFLFITKSGATLSVDAVNENAANQGMILGSLSWTTSSGVSSTKDLETLGYSLPAISPNPVSRNTMIDYSVPETGNIRISLFDQNGRMVKSVFNGRQLAGGNRVELDVTDLAAGQYYLSLIAKEGILTRKVVVQR